MRSFLSLKPLLFSILVAFGLLAPVAKTTQGHQGVAEDSFPIGFVAVLCDDQPPTQITVQQSGCRPADGTVFTATIENGDTLGSCTTAIADVAEPIAAGCSIPAPYGVTVIVSEDPTTLPSGYEPASLSQSFPAPDEPPTGEYGGVTFINLLIASAGDEMPAGTDATATVEADNANEPPTSQRAAEPGSAGTGSPAAIFAGDCDTDLTADPVAVLSEVTAPSGDTTGADTAFAVETSFTTLDLSLDDILAEDHVLVVFDQDDDTVPLACGAIGGVVADDGALAIALPAEADSRYSGIAYPAPASDQTQVTVFLTENLTGFDETPTA